MYCPSCGFETPEGMNFCGRCGTKLSPRCPHCDFENPPGFAFCGKCGASLAEPAPAAHSPSLTGTTPRLQTPIPAHFAEKILHSRAALEGERKQVTVLFADLKGSMELLADRDPEEARQLLDPVLTRMMAAVHRYEGTVNQVMGDGIMALFGAPIAHEDHAMRACYAALAMQASVKQYAGDVQRTRGVPLHIRVGLNSGEVVVRSIGSDLHMDYTAVGQTTHLAARMEQMAMPGSILITAEVLRLVEGYVQVAPLGRVPIKGLQEPAEVYEMTGTGSARTRLEAAAARGLTRFVGRDTEWETLRQALARAGRGHGQVVAAIGESGVGKSRLFWEFTQFDRTRGWLHLESHSVSYGKAAAYLPVVDLLKDYVGIEARDEARTRREKVTGKLLTLDRTLEPTLPALLALLEVPIEEQAWQELDPSQRRRQILEAVKRLLLAESQRQPLLLVFEDLHWIDTETQALLDSLVESLPTARLLLLVNYRPEYQHGWGSKTYYTQLRLDPLPPVSADEFLQALLGDDPSLAPLKQLLIARTEGNPFFLEEGVRTLVETAVLAGTPAAYRLGQPVERLQVPATVQAVLAARIDRLPPEEKRLLQTAAVIGTEVPWPLLQATADVPEAVLDQGLARLQAAEFLYEARLFPELAYTFKHALTHEVAYGSLLQERRQALHARIVEAIEALAGDPVAEQVEFMAHHALQGEVWEKAVSYGRQAGAKGLARSAYAEAVGWFEQALGALQHLPVSHGTQAQAIDLRLELRSALVPLGKLEQILAHLRAAQSLAEAVNDGDRIAWVSCHLTGCLWLMGQAEEAIVLGQRALALAPSSGDSALKVATGFFLGQAYRAIDDYRQAKAILREIVADLTEDQRYERFGTSGFPSVMARTWLVWCLAETGEFAEGIKIGEEALRVADEVDQPLSHTHAYAGLGVLYLYKGDLYKAISPLEHGLRLCRTWDIRSWLPTLASSVGYVYALAGQVAEGLPLLEQAVDQARSSGRATNLAQWITRLGEAYLMAGHVDEALRHGRHALELARDDTRRAHEALALRLLGEIAAQCNLTSTEETEHYYCKALALANELGMRPLVAHCHLGLGRLYHQTGRGEEARVALAAAIDLYRAMDMIFWLPQAEAVLAQVEGR
jgi:class 3 adenylate cyclase/tetratricopeptide (TPR) repeat protein